MERLGVVGLAVARALNLAYPEKTTLLLERNRFVGEETRWVKISRYIQIIVLTVYIDNIAAHVIPKLYMLV